MATERQISYIRSLEPLHMKKSWAEIDQMTVSEASDYIQFLKEWKPEMEIIEPGTEKYMIFDMIFGFMRKDEYSWQLKNR